jgi:hypothetical protein
MKKKIFVALMLVIFIAIIFAGCSEADRVSQNLSLEADNFNVPRRLTVINCIANDVLFQMTGNFSIYADGGDNQLEVTVENNDGTYQKHFIGLSDNVTYIVEDLGSNNVSKYQYTLNFNPKMWIPVDVKNVD